MNSGGFIMTLENSPSLINLNEFCVTIAKRREHPTSSIGGFAYWIKKKGCPKKWPFTVWQKEFQEYLDRKV